MKRFFDSEIWKKPWYMELTPAEKLAWHYITSECNNVGVWTPNFRLAEFIVGIQLDWEKFSEKCNDNIDILPNGKWWLVDFVDFQYGDLRGEIKDKARMSYVKLLKKHGLWEHYLAPSKGLVRGLYAHKDKDKEKDKEKDKDKEGAWNELHEQIEQSCLSQLSDSTQYNYGKERKHIKKLAERFEQHDDAMGFAAAFFNTFYSLKHSNNKFWKGQPLLPSIANSDSIYPRIVEAMNKQDDYRPTGAEVTF